MSMEMPMLTEVIMTEMTAEMTLRPFVFVVNADTELLVIFDCPTFKPRIIPKHAPINTIAIIPPNNLLANVVILDFPILSKFKSSGS